MKKIYNLLFILTILLAFTSCGSKTTEVVTEEHHDEEGLVELTLSQYKRVGIEFGKIEMKNLSFTIAANGMLDVPPQNLVSVSALMGGFIKTTELLQGMQVKKGQVIATIQNPDFIRVQSQYLENKQKLKFLELEYKRQEEHSKENVTASKTLKQVSSEYNSLLSTVAGLEEKLTILNMDLGSLT